MGLLGLCGFLNNEVNSLNEKAGAKDQAISTAAANLKECSDNTDKLKKDEATANENYRAALESAETVAAKNRLLSQQLLASKPKKVVVTNDNKSQFGPEDPKQKLEDYNSAHQLFNEYLTKIKP